MAAGHDVARGGRRVQPKPRTDFADALCGGPGLGHRGTVAGPRRIRRDLSHSGDHSCDDVSAKAESQTANFFGDGRGTRQRLRLALTTHTVNGLEAVTEQKRLLLERANEERNDIARKYYQWQARGEVARKTTRLFRNPIVLASLGLLALKLPWRRTYKAGGWFWKGWKLFRIFRRFI